MWGFLAALISGALMSIQGVFNTEVTKQSSLWVLQSALPRGFLQGGRAFLRYGRWRINTHFLEA